MKKNIEDFKRVKDRRSSGKFLDQKALYTGNPIGTYKRGDKHPFVEGLVYRHWKRSMEFWCTPEALTKHIEKQKEWKQSKRGREAEHRYRGTPARKEAQKKYNKSPKGKKSQLKYVKKDMRKVSANLYAAKRRALEKQFRFEDEEKNNLMIGLFMSWRVRLEAKLGMKFHVDHIIPLTKGGMHHYTNLQVTPARWNCSKGNRNTDRWLPYGF
jgi:5-methylcytosine-specific restriction endonuclease McrA